MNYWSKFPFIRFLIPLMAGILLCYYSNDKLAINYIVLLSGILILVAFNRFLPKYLSYNHRWIYGFLLNTVLAMSGYMITSGTFLKNQPNHFSIHSDSATIYYGKVADQPIQKNRSVKVMLDIIHINAHGVMRNTTGKVVGYMAEDTVSNQIEYGDVIAFTKAPLTVSPPGNPGEFDYAAYLAHKSIFHQVFMVKGSYKIIAHKQGNAIKAFSLNARNWLLNILQQNGISGSEFNVAAALLTGYSQLIDYQQRQEYAGAGVIHILCVSGLHVGIIYLLADRMFFFLRRRRGFYILQPLLIIAIIWLYALLTGLAPPVLRASLMFTILTLGKINLRTSNTLNTLAVAAFVLLVHNPRLLFNVGFQLSFSAVAGILLFHPVISQLLKPKNPFLRNLWNLCAVSLAAQLATAPLAIHYFHQFPNYFIISNIIAIPLAGLLIYTGVLLFLSFPLPAITKIIASVLTYELQALNILVSYIEALPGAVTKNIYFSSESMLISFIIMFMIYYWVVKIRTSYLVAGLAFFLLLISYESVLNYQRNTQQMIVFHKVTKHPVISFIQGRTHEILTDSLIINNAATLEYPLSRFMIQSGLNVPAYNYLPYSSNAHGNSNTAANSMEFYYCNGKKIVVISGDCFLPIKDKTLSVDYVFICHNFNVPLDKLVKCFEGAVYIIDSTVPHWKAKQLEKVAQQNGYPIHNLRSSGALIVNASKRYLI